MKEPKERCFYCDRPATLLCDFVLGLPTDGYERSPDGTVYLVAKIAPMHTCDMPLCRDHAQHRGNIHIKARKPIGGFDTIDHCPEHRDVPDTGARVIRDEEVEQVRRAVRALALRRLMRERGSVPASPIPPLQGELF